MKDSLQKILTPLKKTNSTETNDEKDNVKKISDCFVGVKKTKRYNRKNSKRSVFAEIFNRTK